MLQVSLKQSVNLIRTCGSSNTFLFLGQPGIGKSAMLSMLAAEMPDYHPCYIDCANLDLGDLGMPLIDREEGVTSYAPNVRFGLGRSQTKPCLIMLDELTKPASRAVLNMLLPVILERRIGDRALHPASIVFATGNLLTDGVGDMLPGHAWNRMTVADVRNPINDEWIEDYALPMGLAPEVILFAKETPEAFQRYDELREKQTNPHIFNPRTGNVRACCTPRSLAKASPLVAARDQLGDALLPALAGTIGEPAARKLEASIALSSKLPSLASIVRDPQNAKLPEGVAQYFLMALKMEHQTSEKTIDAFSAYALRWDSFEASNLFASQVSSRTKNAGLTVKSRPFMELATKHGRYV